MIIMEIRKGDLGKLQRFSVRLPKTVIEEIDKAGFDFISFVRKSAKLRAPRFTGYLASGIFMDRKGKSIVLKSVAPYATKQEFGEGLPTYEKISKLSSWFGASRTMGPGMMAGSLPPKKGYVVVRRYKPHIMPAFEAGLTRLPDMLKKGLYNGINKARR